jgi:hypothetical protein
MPVCPSCNYEYVEGIVICPDCNTKLIEEKDISEFEEFIKKGWVLVYTSSDEVEVEMIRGNLVSAGLDARVLSQKDHNFPAPGDLSVVKLLVRCDVQPALEFIQQMKIQNGTEEED